jgi:2-iminobutanoate/2-iminopropanoate deaminase
MKKIHRSNLAPAPVGPYSQAVEANGFIFLSGQISIDPASNEVFVGAVEEQTRRVMENAKAVLSSAHLSFNDVVKTTIFLTNMNDFTKVNEVYAKYFSEAPPARSTIQVAALPKGVAVEVEMTAVRS